jgi:hypothetical protein
VVLALCRVLLAQDSGDGASRTLARTLLERAAADQGAPGLSPIPALLLLAGMHVAAGTETALAAAALVRVRQVKAMMRRSACKGQ